jgi:hypothetical protein
MRRVLWTGKPIMEEPLSADVKWLCYPGIVVLALALALLPGIVRSESACTPDSNRYLALGRSLRAGTYSNADGSAHAFTPPLYPVLAGIATLGSPEEGTSGCPCHETKWPARGALLVVQGALFLWSMAALRRLAGRAGVPENQTWKVALLYGVSPLPLIYAGRVLSETLFVALLLTGLDLLLPHLDRNGSARDRSSWARVLMSGIVFGLASLTRTILLPWIALWPLFALGGGRRCRVLLVCLAGFVVSTAPWVARNFLEYREIGLNPGTATMEYVVRLVASQEAYAKELASSRGQPAQANPFREGRAQALIVAHMVLSRPVRFVRNASVSWLATWSPPFPDLMQSFGLWNQPAGTLELLREHGPRRAIAELILRTSRIAGDASSWIAVGVALLVSIWDMIISGLALLGLFLLVRIWSRKGPLAGSQRQLMTRIGLPRPSKFPALFLGSLILVLTFAPVGVCHPRFRVPLAPVLALLAYPAVMWIVRWRSGLLSSSVLSESREMKALKP